jgi:8-oxo-dGTP diphosphatase
MARERTIVAAGGVVWRPRPGSDDGVELLVAHRPRYDDWSFPKGKQDPGETVRTTAVREIAEETGFHVRLGIPLPSVHYRVGAGPKVVRYWAARLRRDDPGAFVPNREVDEIRWLRPRDAEALLTYEHDRRLLADFRRERAAGHHRTRPLVVLRHGKAVSRSKWSGPDTERPLNGTGQDQATALADVLAVYALEQVITSPAERCRSTVAPFAQLAGLPITEDPRLAEDRPPADLAAAVLEALDRPAVVCSHRPVLPDAFAALDLSAVDLAPGEGVVVHHRGGRVVATERLG